MKKYSVVAGVLVLISGLIIGCGGDGATSVVTDGGSTTATTSTTSGSAGSTGSTITVGSYSGTFAGSNTPPENLVYSGTGTGTITSGGAATFAYTATTKGSATFTFSRNFTGTIDSKNNFTGTIAFAPGDGGAVQNYAATGPVTIVSATEVKVKLTWSYPDGASSTPAYTSIENWDLKLKS